MCKRKKVVPEEVFYNDATTLIQNCFIDNPNFKNGYYYNHRVSSDGIRELIRDIQFSAQLLLDRLESEKHLIGIYDTEEDNTRTNNDVNESK